MKNNGLIILMLALIAGLVFLMATSNSDQQVNFANRQNEPASALFGQLNSNNVQGRINPGRITPYPVKTAAYWTRPIMYENDALNLAKHDLVIVDLENMFNNRQVLLLLKSLNPNLKLIAYSNPMEIFTETHTSRPWQAQKIKEIIERRQAWLLKTIVFEAGAKMREDYARFYPGMTMLNMSSVCPKINGETYTEWIAKKIRTEILVDSIWDGYFMDNGTSNIAWTNHQDGQRKSIDIDGNRRPDSDAYVDLKWKEGVNKYLDLVVSEPQPFSQRLLSFLGKKKKSVRKDMIIISNKGDLYLTDRVDGKFFEKFPNDYLGDKWAGGWGQCLQNAEKTGEYTIFNVAHANETMFALASALLLDNVYISISQDNAGVFPELEIDLGRPLEKYRHQNGIYTRRYQHGLVRVNPLAKKGEIIR